MDTILEGRRLNQLQAAQALFDNIDTSSAQVTERSLLMGAMRARGDIDRIMMDNSAVIAGGLLPNGAAVQFDLNSQDMMDRVIGVYLTQLAGIVGRSNGSILSRGLANAPIGQTLALQDLLMAIEDARSSLTRILGK